LTTVTSRRWAPIAVIILIAVMLSACGGGPPPATSWSGLIVSGETAYLAATDRIYAIDTNRKTPNSNRLLWSFPPLDQNATVTFHGQPALSEDGALFAGSDSLTGQGAIIALDTTQIIEALSEGTTVRKTAKPQWSYPPDDKTPSPGSIFGGVTYDGASIYAATNDGRVFSFDAATGAPHWVFTATQRIWSSPVVSGSMVYAAAQDHNLYALNAATGRPVWNAPFKASALLAGTPTVYGNTIYVGSIDQKVYAVNAADGTPKWPQPFEAQGWVWDGPILFDNVLYFGDLSGNFYALSREGTPVWTQPLKLDGGIRAQPLVTPDTLYVPTLARKLYAIDRATQAIKWTFTAEHDGEQLMTTPVLVGDLILVAPVPSGGSPVRLYAVDAESGNLVWRYPAPESQ